MGQLLLPPRSSNRSFLLSLTFFTYFLVNLVTIIRAEVPVVPSSYSESALEYPNNGSVSQQPPASISAGNGTSRADRRKFFSLFLGRVGGTRR